MLPFSSGKRSLIYYIAVVAALFPGFLSRAWSKALRTISLFLSQNFHRDWVAQADTNHGWQAAQTVEVNGVFQGVLLPSETHRVRLDFMPFARYAWIAHFFWFLLLLLAGAKSWQGYRLKALERV